jgi:hypothetical protein
MFSRMNPWAELLASISMLAVVGFGVAAWFWIVDRRDIRRLRHLTRFRLLTLFIVTTFAAFTLGILKATGELQSLRDLGSIAQASAGLALIGGVLWLLGTACGHFRELFIHNRTAQLPDVMPDKK